ncbi:hypothetical protein CEY15_04565 [Dietzia natronolimnaea]|uniref:Uncharacterized protein n=1 Tax=Dietzia natronolimnaea TaxID=161920 RepID=A0A2A2WSV2_9ACTN|nr:hypothetical protein CEY15_04565 [Dietzia natronolimnaea]
MLTWAACSVADSSPIFVLVVLKPSSAVLALEATTSRTVASLSTDSVNDPTEVLAWVANSPCH